MAELKSVLAAKIPLFTAKVKFPCPQRQENEGGACNGAIPQFFWHLAGFLQIAAHHDLESLFQFFLQFLHFLPLKTI